MPPNQISGETATTPGICSIRCLWESGSSEASPVACCTTRRLAPRPPEGSASIAFRSDTRTTISTSTRMIEPVVRTIRVFLRKTFLQTRRKYFIGSSSHPAHVAGLGQLVGLEHALVEMHHPVRAGRRLRVVRHHDDRLPELLIQTL